MPAPTVGGAECPASFPLQGSRWAVPRLAAVGIGHADSLTQSALRVPGWLRDDRQNNPQSTLAESQDSRVPFPGGATVGSWQELWEGGAG